MSRSSTCLIPALFLAAFSGCCGMGGPGACGTGCGSGLDGRFALSAPARVLNGASCQSGCGEVYIDEWINETPTADNCGYNCGGCGQCGTCRPVLSMLKLLWGRPYINAGCDSCGTTGHVTSHAPTAGGCDSCSGHSGAGMQMGVRAPSNMLMEPSATPMPPATMPSMPSEMIPPTPTPAPEVSPSSAQRLSPVRQR